MARVDHNAPPNILFLFTDQQRPDTIGALGNSLIRTPNLDTLVREGTSFDRAYTPSPVCVAARHACITGLPPHLTGMVDNMEEAPVGRSMMEMLSACGYETHGTGKMHFCGDARKPWGFATRDYSEELDPDDDFAVFLRDAGYAHVSDPHGFRSEHYYLPQPSQLPVHLHHTAWVADRSIEFLKRRDRTRPFFLWSSFIKPHPPFETPNPWSRLYRSAEMPDPVLAAAGEGHRTFWNRVQNRYKYMDGGVNPHLVRTQRAAYYAAISFVDHHVGRILEELGEDRDRTLIVFSSDHGEMLGDFGCFGKRCMLEPSARVPLLVRQPGRFEGGARCSTPVSLLDLFPTFAAAAASKETRPYARSEDLAEIAAGGLPDRSVTSQFSQRSLGLYMLTDARWKYIHSAADRKEWLFDLQSDPGELNNLADSADAAGALVAKREEILRLLTSDGCEWAVDGGRWRDYGVTELPGDPRSGLLFQDPPSLAAAMRGLGAHARIATNPGRDWLAPTLPESMDAVTGRISFEEPQGSC